MRMLASAYDHWIMICNPVQRLNSVRQRDAEELLPLTFSIRCQPGVDVSLGFVMVGHVYEVDHLEPLRNCCGGAQLFGAVGWRAAGLADLQQWLPKGAAAHDVDPPDVSVLPKPLIE
jgi:hypothetical protein